VAGNEVAFTDQGTFDDSRSSLTFSTVDGVWKAARSAASTMVFHLNEEYSAWYASIEAGYRQPDGSSYSRIRWGDSVLAQDQVLAGDGLLVAKIHGSGSSTQFAAAGQTVTLDGDLLVDLHDYDSAKGRSFDLITAREIRSAFDNLLIEQPASTYSATVTLVDTDADTVADTLRLTVTRLGAYQLTVIDSDTTANTVADNAAVGTPVGLTVRATDDVDGESVTFTYSLADSAGGRFAIDATTGVVTVAAPLDQKAASSYTLVVRATGSDGYQSEVSFTIAATRPAADVFEVKVAHWRDASPMGEVLLSLTSTSSVSDRSGTSDTTGLIAFDVLEAGAYTLLPGRSADDSIAAITSADAMAALKLALGRNPNPDPDGPGPLQPAAVSPYQWIAADINADGQVDRADAQAILKIAQGSATATDALPQWVFVDAQAVLSAIDAAQVGLPAMTALVAAGADQSMGLVGVLRGDVDGSWSVLNV
jgi:hypothetical protein